MTRPKIFDQDYHVDVENKNCFIRFRSEKYRPNDPADKPICIRAGTPKAWNGAFALPASIHGIMSRDCEKAMPFLTLNSRDKESRALSRVVRSGNPSGNQLFEAISILSKVENDMINAHNQDKGIPALEAKVAPPKDWLESAQKPFISLDEIFSDDPKDKPTFATDKPVKTGARAAYQAAQAKPGPVKTQSKGREEAR